MLKVVVLQQLIIIVLDSVTEPDTFNKPLKTVVLYNMVNPDKFNDDMHAVASIQFNLLVPIMLYYMNLLSSYLINHLNIK